MRARRAVPLAISAVLIAFVSAGLTYALLGDDVAMAMPMIRAGGLDIEPVGGPTWTETSPGVTPAHTIATAGAQGTAQHLATPGDTFVLRQRFRTVLTGDAVAARVTVRWSTPPSLQPAGGVTATYAVTMPDGTSSPSVPVGSPVTVPGGTANLRAADVAGWGDAPWEVTVRLAYTGTSSVVVPPSAVGSAPVTALGTVVVELAQVRTGDGFR